MKRKAKRQQQTKARTTRIESMQVFDTNEMVQEYHRLVTVCYRKFLDHSFVERKFRERFGIWPRELDALSGELSKNESYMQRNRAWLNRSKK